MRFSTSLKKNYEFRRLYTRGKSAASPLIAVYCRKNRLGVNRLGITVNTKIGNAVQRNRIRRRLKETYRLNEEMLRPGYDIVIVARVKCRYAHFRDIESDFLRLGKTLNFLTVTKNEKNHDCSD